MDLSANFLQSFAEADPEYQQKFIDQVRESDTMRTEVSKCEQERLERVEQLWQRIPKWRRAIILILDKLQRAVTPKWFRGA